MKIWVKGLVSRAAISKHIKGIQEWGLDIYRVQGKDMLACRLDMLDQRGCQLLAVMLLWS